MPAPGGRRSLAQCFSTGTAGNEASPGGTTEFPLTWAKDQIRIRASLLRCRNDLQLGAPSDAGKMSMMKNTHLLAFILCLASSIASAQARPYPGPDVQQLYQHYLEVVSNIAAFDHHAHPGFADDPDVDAMAAPPGSAAFRERETNPELVAAAKALWGYPYNDFSAEHAKWLIQKKAEVKKQYPGTAYFSMLLDKLNFDRGVANRALMPDYLDPKRFPWVFFVDSFLWPFDNSKERARNGDQQVYIPLQEKMLKRWMQQERLSVLPAGFGDYLKFVSQVLEDNRKNKGGIAMKFEVAYFRPLHFSDCLL